MKELSEIINKVHCGDCLEFMREMPDKCVDLVLTDPPYGIGVGIVQPVGGRGEKNKDNEQWDKQIPLKEYFEEIKRVSKNRIIWGANYFNCFEQGSAIVWDKLQPLPDSSQCEIASCSKGKKVHKYTQRWTNFVNTKVSEHPTEKPLELMRWCLELFPEAQTVLDPFLGSGTTAVAAKQLGRKYIGVELSQKYCDIANERLKQDLLF